MARSLRERAKDWKWWGEQVAHAIMGGAVGMAALWADSAWECLVFVIVFGLIREALQWPIDSWGDAAVDLGAVILGGAIVFAL